MQAGEAAVMLRRARRRARLSQTELGRRAQVAQSVISAYESGRREPSLRTLSRLVEATGHHLTLHLEATPDARPGLPDTPLGRLLRQRRQQVLAVAAGRGARNVRVFGSVARAEDGPDSDVDLLVDLAPGTGLVGLAGLTRELTEVLGTAVDVIPADNLKLAVDATAKHEAIPL